VDGKSLIIAALAVIILAGLVGGDHSVTVIGSFVGKAFHWVNLTWQSAMGNRNA
jgi:hypothetical protein